MKNKIRKAALLCVVFIISIAVLWGFLSASSAIPNESIKENMTRSALMFKSKGAFEIPENKRLCGVADNFADAILLGVAWNMGDYGALDTKYYSGGEYGENAGLYLSIVDESTAPDTDYTRYWHGNAGVARVLHLFTDINGMKAISIALICALALFVIVALFIKRCPRSAICFILSLASVQIWNVRLSLEYQPVFVIAMLMCALFIMLERKGAAALAVLAVVGGVFTAFFDFLTCETLPILLPLALVFAMRTEQGRGEVLSKNIKLIAMCCACFILAYLGAFVVKWSLATIFTAENKFLLAASSAGVRFAGESGGFLSGILANLTVIFAGTARVELARVAIGAALYIGVLGSAFYLLKNKKRDKALEPTLLMLATIVLVRYAVLQNHSYLHEFFTYRALATTVFSSLATVALSGRKKG